MAAASMAASSALLQGALTTGAPQSNSRKVLPSYSGLRACPLVKKQACSVPVARATWRPVTIFCAAAEDTLKQCQQVVAKQLGIDVATVKPETKFSDLGADSLDTVEIVMALEEEFKISVEQEGAEKIVTVKDAADVIHQLVLQKEKSA